MEKFVMKNTLNVAAMSMRQLETNCKGNDVDGQNDHIINDALQFCDRFSDVDESLTDNSDSENSDYEPKSTWEVSDYIVCIDKVGILTDKAISNLPNTFFVVIYAHEMLIQALNLKKSISLNNT